METEEQFKLVKSMPVDLLNAACDSIELKDIVTLDSNETLLKRLDDTKTEKCNYKRNEQFTHEKLWPKSEFDQKQVWCSGDSKIKVC